jgi:addiction module RelE/StbE family toxin
MKKIFTTSRFERRLKNFTIKHPEFGSKINQIMKLIASDYKHPSLKTHGLSGNLKGCFAASISYEYRIVFTVNLDFVCFIDIGDHDHAY